MDRPTVEECRIHLATTSVERLPAVIRAYDSDKRSGVKAAVASARLRLAKEMTELQRVRDMLRFETKLRENGIAVVAGVDEVGRGALAGPLTVGAVILPSDCPIRGLDDSKRLSSNRRIALDREIKKHSVAWCVVHVWPDEIDQLGITALLRRAANEALMGLRPTPDHVLLDGLPLGLECPETAVVSGDGSIASIAAASIVAKVARDQIMTRFHERYPAYEFASNKGYGTAAHLHAIRVYGLTPLHRRSFAPCNEVVKLSKIRVSP